MSEKILIGIIGRAYGIKGYFTVKSFSDFPERFAMMKKIKLTMNSEENIFPIENVYVRNNKIFMKIKGVDSREDAMQFNGKQIFIDKNERMKLEEGRYYISDLIYLDVFDKKNKRIGIVTDVIDNGVTNILVIRNGEVENLVPMVREFIDNIDIKTKKIIISPIEGMINAH